MGNILKRCLRGTNTKDQFKWLDFELIKHTEIFLNDDLYEITVPEIRILKGTILTHSKGHGLVKVESGLCLLSEVSFHFGFGFPSAVKNVMPFAPEIFLQLSFPPKSATTTVFSCAE